MRILIVSTFFPPRNSSASLRAYSWAKFWSQMGHDVTVVTVGEEGSQERVERLTLVTLSSIGERIKSVLKRGKNSSQASQGPIKPKRGDRLINNFRNRRGIFNACRMPDFADLWVPQVMKWLRASGLTFDLVVSTAGPYSTHRIGCKVKKRGIAARWVADYRDLWSNSYIYPGVFPFNRMESFLEKRYLRSADLITTVSQGLKSKLSSLSPGKRISVIENGFDEEEFGRLDPEPIFSSDQKVRIVYTGLIYEGKRDPTPLLEAISNLACSGDRGLLERLEVIFVGPCGRVITELAEKFSVSRWVVYRGFVERSESLRMQRDASALLFLPWTDPKGDGTLTGKLYEYLYSNRPIWVVGADYVNEAQRVMKELGVGEFLGRDVKKIEERLVELLKGEGKEVKGEAREQSELARRFSRRVLAEKMLQELVLC